MILQDQKRYRHVSLNAEAQDSGSSPLAFRGQSVSPPGMCDVLKIYGLTGNRLWKHPHLDRKDCLPDRDVQAGKVVEKKDGSHHQLHSHIHRLFLSQAGRKVS